MGEISAKRERGVPSIDNTSLSLLFMDSEVLSMEGTTPRYPYYLWSEVEIFFNQRIRMAKEELLSGS